MPMIRISCRLTTKALFEADAPSLRATVEAAVEAGADLHGAGLRGADLRDAALHGADLHGADLRDAVLRGAGLRDADLSDADLSGAARLPAFQIPQDGDLTVWKRCRRGLVKLLIPAAARRTASLVGRKCRAEHAVVLEVLAGAEDVSRHDGRTIYRVGETVRPAAYSDDPRVECAPGIHFFLTRAEAEDHA